MMRPEIEELSKYGDCAWTVKQRVEYLLENLFKERDRYRASLEFIRDYKMGPEIDEFLAYQCCKDSARLALAQQASEDKDE